MKIRTTVKNKYNLTMSKIRRLKVADKSRVAPPLFWRNDVIKAWCISESSGNEADRTYGTDCEYWIGVYDDDAPHYAGKFRVELSAYGGMCRYNIEHFFRSEDIEYEVDLRVQELFLTKINQLIDAGVLQISEK